MLRVADASDRSSSRRERANAACWISSRIEVALVTESGASILTTCSPEARLLAPEEDHAGHLEGVVADLEDHGLRVQASVRIGHVLLWGVC